MSILFALVLFGCSDDGATCQRLSRAPERYSSASLCEADLDAALESDLALRSDFPTVISRCLRVDTHRSLGRQPVTLALRHAPVRASR